MTNPATASQTVGPFFSIGLSYRNGNSLCAEDTEGAHIQISGQVLDGEGIPVPDAQLELWQADCKGRFVGIDPSFGEGASDGFQGFARVPTDEHGAFRFHSVYPGSVAGAAGTRQAPHIVVLLSMRGLLKHLFTRIYFAGDPFNLSDPILHAVPSERRQTLLAQSVENMPGHYKWDICLQGKDETVFFLY
jgi:protocatechuate 3,4-dioxygenase alpha subunit